MVNEEWQQNQQNLITFVMVDAAGNEVAGLGAGFTLTISKNGSPVFAASSGTKGEMAGGWYFYLSTALEADVIGTRSIIVTGPGCKQQNLEYIVKERTITAVDFTYTVTEDVFPFNPIEGVQVWFSTDMAGNNVVWNGVTDTFGVARDETGELPFLDPGTYYIWSQKADYQFVNPDTEVVS